MPIRLFTRNQAAEKRDTDLPLRQRQMRRRQLLPSEQPQPHPQPHPPSPPLGTPTRRLLENTLAQALKLSHNYIGDEYLSQR